MDDYINFQIDKNQYSERLKSVDEQQKMNPEEMLNNLSGMKNFAQEFDGNHYRLHFENKEEFAEGQQLLVSDDALVQYYEKKGSDDARRFKIQIFHQCRRQEV